MVCRHNDELETLVKEAKKVTDKGEVASYIPALAKANQHDLSVAIYYSNHTCLSAGDVGKNIYASKYIEGALTCFGVNGIRQG